MDASRCVEERADERVRNAEKHARLADERATQVIRAERQVTSHRLKLQSRNVNRLSRKLADDYTMLNAKQKEDSDAATVKKKADIDAASAAAASAAASAAANIILSLRFSSELLALELMQATVCPNQFMQRRQTCWWCLEQYVRNIALLLVKLDLTMTLGERTKTSCRVKRKLPQRQKL